MDKLKHIPAGFVALIFTVFGSNKLFQFMPMPDMNDKAGAFMGAFAASGYMFPLLAISEIVAGVLIAIPKTRVIGAIILMPLTLNILLFHIFLSTPGLVMSIILFVINSWLLYDDRKKIGALL